MKNTQSKQLGVMRLNKHAALPKRATSGSAGYDLCTCIQESVTLEPGETVVLPTGLAVVLPQQTAGMIFTRSGLGLKHGIHVTNGVGVVDWDYRGEIQVGLHNLSNTPYTFVPGERVAQLILLPVSTPEVVELTALPETDRGTGGFGSTGK